MLELEFPPLAITIKEFQCMQQHVCILLHVNAIIRHAISQKLQIISGLRLFVRWIGSMRIRSSLSQCTFSVDATNAHSMHARKMESSEIQTDSDRTKYIVHVHRHSSKYI